MTVETLLDDVEQLPSADWTLVRYETLVQSPLDTLQRITRFGKLELDSSLRTKLNDVLPISSMTLSEPATEKWRRSAWELDQVRALWMPVEARLERLLEPVGPDVARPELPPTHQINWNRTGMADGGARPSPW
jgi:hypothetical protein